MALVCKIDAISSAEMASQGGGAPAFYTLYEAEIAAFITAVNAHASNSTRQLTLEAAPSTTTSNLFNGFVFSMDHPTYGKLYVQDRMGNSLTTGYVIMGTTWTPGTAIGGLGTVTGSVSSDTFSSMFSTAGAADVVIFYDTTEGSEFFLCNWRTNSSSSQKCSIVFKDTEGDWVYSWAHDSSSQIGCNVAGVKTGTGWIEYDYVYEYGVSTTYFQVIPGFNAISSIYSSSSADALATKDAIRCANSRLGFCNSTDPLVPFTVAIGADWISVGSKFAVNATGLIS